MVSSGRPSLECCTKLMCFHKPQEYVVATSVSRRPLSLPLPPRMDTFRSKDRPTFAETPNSALRVAQHFSEAHLFPPSLLFSYR